MAPTFHLDCQLSTQLCCNYAVPSQALHAKIDGVQCVGISTWGLFLSSAFLARKDPKGWHDLLLHRSILRLSDPLFVVYTFLCAVLPMARGEFLHKHICSKANSPG